MTNINYEENFLTLLKDRKAVISVVGLGYVGLPLALSFAEAGFQVLGLDVDEDKVSKIARRESYIGHITSERLRRSSGLFSATSDFNLVSTADAIIICVPTPLTENREPDLSFVEGTLYSLLPQFRAGQLLSMESTTYPGTTQEVLRPPIEKKGLEIGRDFFLVYSPEREDPANPDFNTQTIPKVIGGATESCARVGLALYGQVVDKMVPVSSTQAAELTKLLENIYRAVNIGLVNELKLVAEAMGLDIHEVINAAATKPFGFTPFYPGPGIGGHCIPIDPFYLTWKARAFGLHTRFIELAGEINAKMPEHVVQKLAKALNKESKPLKNSKILLLGMAYKKNVEDMRESPSLEVLKLLLEGGAQVDYSDPHVPILPRTRKGSFELKSVPLTEENLALYDAVVLLTDHRAFDKGFIKKHSRLVVDTRGAIPAGPTVIKA
ncbi:MAG: nucleotide sugar dehydrogenase [Deltaproteobacteria bacterium]|jgi:UDP-N-acetyl-D-glucosamine dehydrogenase|nr:nucleotide sugar dehydrogenase [Deltaproteobacteria bacterium]